ncbi:MAG TPA: CHAT domain-containing tetratricopeptide repeat protein [Thermoanaerobaculia bacterium]|nr:CHAT domain-containing tetratricopeptide repeat protein [Thermoanaerobaculia bacterium]
MLQQKSRVATSLLEEIVATREATAEVWSDLAAARYEMARTGDDPVLLAHALVAVDAALRRDPQLREALFNRALILERMGMRDQGREAWLHYAKVEADREWADEARVHASELGPILSFRTTLDKQWQRLATDAGAARDLARDQPQDSRRWGETKILGEWATAALAGDSVKAAKCLRIAREFGGELARSRGEGMLKAAVAAIDRADATQRRHLIDAHRAFYDAQQAFKKDRAADAQPDFVRAAKEFELGGSPLAVVAQYYLAHTFHALGDLKEARRREEQLLAAAPSQFPAHRASLLWHLGLAHQADGEWGKALAAFSESAAIFERIGETDNAFIVRGLIAEVYDRTGDLAAAWPHRLAALRSIGRQPTERLQATLSSIARGAIARKEWPLAASILELASVTAHGLSRPLLEADMRLLQARAFAIMQRPRDAALALSRGRGAAMRVHDDALKEGVMAEVMATEAIVAASSEEAIALLSAAIEHHRTRGRRIRLPEMLLSRGKAYASTGEWERARLDFEAGLNEIEQQRAALPQGEARWGIFGTAEELFQSAIGLALEQHDVERAFAHVERSRSRELLEVLAPTGAARSLPSEVVVVEYVVLPEKLAIFIADGDRVQVVEQSGDPAVLERDAARFIAAVQKNSGEMRILGRSLYDRLIAPVEKHIAGNEIVAIVPAPSLAALPFSALVRRDGQFVAKGPAFVHVPSAAVLAELMARARPRASRTELLVIANPATGEGLERLPSAEREARRLTRAYGRSIALFGELATVEAFARNASSADVIHFGTHGAAPSGPKGEAALVLVDGRLGVTKIAATRLRPGATVIVASCSSARGTVRAEGTISVARAFLAAGASSVISTLWPIDDASSADFFPVLHEHLSRGASPAHALRAAQIDAIRRNLPPSLWSAVQCTGY